MITTSKSIDDDSLVKPCMTWEGVCEAVAYLATPAQIGLLQRIQAVTHEKNPIPFVSALGDLFHYMDALNDARLLCFEEKCLIRDFVLQGWSEWRASFPVRGVFQ